jgi:hypothetical protein
MNYEIFLKLDADFFFLCSQLEDLASSIEASLRSSENPFHPDNPEGSIIKDLLLKTRSGLLAVPKDAVESRGWSLAILEAQNQRPGEAAEKKAAVLEAIPIPKSILGAGSGGGARASPVAESYYQCDQCQVIADPGSGAFLTPGSGIRDG